MSDSDDDRMQSFISSSSSSDLESDLDITPRTIHNVKVGTIDVSLTTGNLPDQQCDIVVISATRKLDLQAGPLSKSIAEQAGPSLQAECTSKYPKGIQHGEIAVLGSGSLASCKHVFCGALPRYRQANKTSDVQMLEKLITVCLQEASKLIAGSICFPAIGTGWLGFPTKVVASTTLNAIQAFLANNPSSSVKRVCVVLFNDVNSLERYLPIFEQEFKTFTPIPIPAAQECKTRAISSKCKTPTSKPTPAAHERLPESFIEFLNTFQHEKQATSSPVSESKVATSSPNPAALRSSPLRESKVATSIPTPAALRSSPLREFKMLTSKPTPEVRERVSINVRHAKQATSSPVSSIFEQESKVATPRPTSAPKRSPPKESKTPTSRPTPAAQQCIPKLKAERATPSAPSRNTPEFCLFACQRDIHPPSNWTRYTNSKTVKLWMSEQGNADYQLVDVDQSTFTSIDRLVQGTWNHEHLGHGRDAKNLGELNYSKLKVLKVQRLENVALYDRYARKQQKMLRKAGQSQMFASLARLDGIKERTSKTDQFLDDSLKCDLYPEVNEGYYFHGTKKDRIVAVCQSGIDPQRSQSGAVFGPAVYMAESSSKSDQYADDRNDRRKTDLVMLLMRTNLGRICLMNKAVKMQRPPCVSHCPTEEECDHTRCNSVVQEGHYIFREFIVYKSNYVYPEYVITYNRE